MKKIKILYTIPNFDTAGSGKALLNIAMGLNKEIFEPHILCMNRKGAFFKVVEDSGIPIYVYNYIPKERPLTQMFRECWKVSRRLRHINPDIIHSFHYSSNYTEALASKLAGITWVFTKKNMSWGGSSKNSWLLRSFFAKKIAVQNQDMITQFYPKSSKVSLIPRGVIAEQFKKAEPDFKIKARMNTNENQRVLICVANFVPVKGIETLIDAFAKIYKNHADWVLWLVGDDQNEYGLLLHEKVNDSLLSNKIIFSGKQLNVTAYLNHAEIFVLPTLDEGRREGSPVALLEAMANGKVVIGSKVSGIKDQLTNYPLHLFTSKDSSELAEKLDYFMNLAKDNLIEIGLGFTTLAVEKYSIDVEIKKHEELYKSAVNS
jgi:glycosyltransferase involved in cell wall biosynthesis